MHSHHQTTKNYGAAHTVGCYIIRYDRRGNDYNGHKR